MLDILWYILAAVSIILYSFPLYLIIKIVKLIKSNPDKRLEEIEPKLKQYLSICIACIAIGMILQIAFRSISFFFM